MSSPLNTLSGSTLLFPMEKSKHWLVRMDKPAIGVVTKAQIVDYYTQLLTKVMGTTPKYDECARELAGVPGVLSVQPDKNFDSDNKNYGAMQEIYGASGYFIEAESMNKKKCLETIKLTKLSTSDKLEGFCASKE
ncbi:unnamed protein product [Camellia sinensis]